MKPDSAAENAAILLWQSRFRLILIIAVGVLTVALQLTGAVTEASVISARYGADPALAAFVALTLLYFGFISLVALRMKAKGRIGAWARWTTMIADVVTFNGAVLLAAPPAWYEVALILCTFSLLLELLYSGWRAAVWDLVIVVATYLSMLYIALSFGSELQLTETFWTLGVFTAGMMAFATLHANLAARLSMIVRLFDRTRDGVFALSYDETSGSEPDAKTVIGVAYEKMRKELTALILTDPLTQCFNPRGFEQMSTREISRCARHDARITLLAIDIDHFKSVNDTYGHLAGDQVLREIGLIFRNTARLTDVVARTGGEEFSILAPDTDEQGAGQFANRLLEACRKHRFADLGDRPVTISIGIASARAKDAGALQLLRSRADEALYAAKRDGRNRAARWADGRLRITGAMDALVRSAGGG
jgi:diguanylate cyclase (GGDEF)-like protein